MTHYISWRGIYNDALVCRSTVSYAFCKFVKKRQKVLVSYCFQIITSVNVLWFFSNWDLFWQFSCWLQRGWQNGVISLRVYWVLITIGRKERFLDKTSRGICVILIFVYSVVTSCLFTKCIAQYWYAKWRPANIGLLSLLHW